VAAALISIPSSCPLAVSVSRSTSLRPCSSRRWYRRGALDQIDDILTRLAGRSLGDGRLHDASGQVVVSYPAPTWEAFLSLAIDVKLAALQRAVRRAFPRRGE